MRIGDNFCLQFVRTLGLQLVQYCFTSQSHHRLVTMIAQYSCACAVATLQSTLRFCKILDSTYRVFNFCTRVHIWVGLHA